MAQPIYSKNYNHIATQTHNGGTVPVPGSGLPQLWRGLPDALLPPQLASQQLAQQIEKPPEPGSVTVPPAVLSPVQPAAVAAADERKLVAPGRQAVLCVSPEDAEPGQEREGGTLITLLHVFYL